MSVHSDRVAGIVLNEQHAMLALRGELDFTHHDELSVALDEARHAARHLCVDLADVEFVDWISLSLIVRAASLQRQGGGSVVVTGASTIVRRVVSLMGAEEVLASSSAA